jgi:hypothetical protein
MSIEQLQRWWHLCHEFITANAKQKGMAYQGSDGEWL